MLDFIGQLYRCKLSLLGLANISIFYWQARGAGGLAQNIHLGEVKGVGGLGGCWRYELSSQLEFYRKSRHIVELNTFCCYYLSIPVPPVAEDCPHGGLHEGVVEGHPGPQQADRQHWPKTTTSL